MKSFISLLIVISFGFSLSAGESLCCDGDFTVSNLEIAQDSHAAHGSSNNKLHNDSFRNNCDNSDGHDQDHEHQCVGCSHAPFLNSWSDQGQKEIFEAQVHFSHYENLFSSPYLDGPFQPPKSNI